MNSPLSDALKRLAGCLAFSFVLALMVGPQEGNQGDFGYAFRAAIFDPRILVFIVIGLLAFTAITFWPRITPFLVRPGVRPLVAGGITVLAAMQLLQWTNDSNVGAGKFSDLAKAASSTAALSPVSRQFFSNYVAWILLVVTFGLCAAALVLGARTLAWVAAGLAVLSGIWAYAAHALVSDYIGTPDHSTGAAVALLGYLVMAAAGLTSALSKSETANTRALVVRVAGWRPGFPLVVLGAVVGLVSLLLATWFSPTNHNTSFGQMSSLFSGNGLGGVATQYLSWLGWLLFAVSLGLAAASTYLRQRVVGWAAAVVGIVSVLLTLVTIHGFGEIGAKLGVDGSTGAWQNNGSGGWMACAAFMLFAGAGYIAATAPHEDAESQVPESSDDASPASKVAGLSKVVMVVVIAGALFYPPTATGFWQTVLVSEIGIYVLLAIGLNVVVGWAGLLDLGFIAFYAIGSYTTAFLTGTLPVKPPHWLLLSPLWAIPFAVMVCLLAGVALGFPTLRLRGDYLAIVTLGFGEIIRIVAINADKVTNGPKGAFGIPAPVLHIGPLVLKWGSDPLQFWYLLLVLIGITVLLFNRLEHSRLGRAWAAIREDEVAAQATGVNTTRVKLLAFAIGASTSGVAGVFFASQIGYINPDNFVLNNSILVVAYVVFGGMGSLRGAMAGAAVLTWLPEFLKDQVPAEDRQMWIGAVILLMMIFRPGGLIPAKRRAAELSGLDAPSSAETRAVAAGEGLGAPA
jgi:ABC-type branched-subunit amino acid transport system permease subunit